MSLSVMFPAHPRWPEFIERLSGPEGCDFSERGSVCSGGNDKHFALAILGDMGDIDIEASIALFEENCGFCDCEIIFNVEDVFNGSGQWEAGEPREIG